jgi:hypothetical protein
MRPANQSMVIERSAGAVAAFAGYVYIYAGHRAHGRVHR